MSAPIRNTISAILALLLLGGCAKEIEGWEVNALVKACESHGGVERFKTFGIIYAVCRNGKTISAERPK